MPNSPIHMGFLSSLKSISFPQGGLITFELAAPATGDLDQLSVAITGWNAAESVGSELTLMSGVAGSGPDLRTVTGKTVSDWGGVANPSDQTQPADGILVGGGGEGGSGQQNLIKGSDLVLYGIAWPQPWPLYFDDIHTAGTAFLNLKALRKAAGLTFTLALRAPATIGVTCVVTLYKPDPTSFNLLTGNTLPPYLVPTGGTKKSKITLNTKNGGDSYAVTVSKTLTLSAAKLS